MILVLLNRLFPTKMIDGCEARGDKDLPYMYRTVLLQTRWGHLYLHRIVRSDYRVFHDHPWAFVSLMLWRGYVEVTPWGERRTWPGMVLRRPADWVHRIELVGEKPALSLIWVGRKTRTWGFLTVLENGGCTWEAFTDYFRRWGC